MIVEEARPVRRALLLGVVVLALALPGCVTTRSAERAIVDDFAGWTMTYDGPLERSPADLDFSVVRPEMAPIAARGWVRVFERDTERIGLGLLYTGQPVTNRYAAARRLRRFFQIVHWEWVPTDEDLPGAVTLIDDEGPEPGTWVHGGNFAYFVVIRADGASPEAVEELFEQQIAALPEYKPFDSIRPGMTAVFLVMSLLALVSAVRLHRWRRDRLPSLRVQVFPWTWGRRPRRERFILGPNGNTSAAVSVGPARPDGVYNNWRWLVAGVLSGITVHMAFDIGRGEIGALIGGVAGIVAIVVSDRRIRVGASRPGFGVVRSIAITDSRLLLLDRRAIRGREAGVVASLPLERLRGVRVDRGRFGGVLAWFIDDQSHRWKVRTRLNPWLEFRSALPHMKWRTSGDAFRLQTESETANL